MRCLYSPVKDRRLASATTSGFGRGEAGGWRATVLPAAVLRVASLRSSSLRSAAGKTVGETEAIPLFFTLTSVLALLTNYDRENCLINVGTEGSIRTIRCFSRMSVEGEFQIAGRSCARLKSTSLLGAGADWLSSSNSCSLLSSSLVFCSAVFHRTSNSAATHRCSGSTDSYRRAPKRAS